MTKSSSQNAGQRRVFRFGDHELDEARGTLCRSGELVHITRKPWSLLLHLLQNPQRTFSWEELLRPVWEGQRRDAATVRSAVRAVRVALGDREPWRWVGEVPGFGYRFLQDVQIVAPDALPEPEPSAPALTTDAPRALSPRDPRAFLDRETELARLCAALDAARDARRQLVLLHGPPGIGKTRTATELAQRAHALGFDVHCGETESSATPAFGPWLPILQALTGHGAALDELLRGSAAQPHGLGAPEERQRRSALFERIAALLEETAQRRPLLLVLDDMHAADEDSVDLLLALARSRRLFAARLLLVVAHRELETGHLLTRVLHEPGTDSIPLRGLRHGPLEEILAATLGRSLSRQSVERILLATGGNPYFVSEVARMLAARGLDAERPLPIPESVRDVVRMRLAECSPACRALLQAASVIGFEFRLPLLVRALGWSQASCLDALAEALRLDLVVALAAAHRFQHGLVRDVLLAELPAAARAALHRSVGEAIEALHAPLLTPHLAQLAYHFGESACLAHPERAVDFARRAAERMKSISAYVEASHLYRRALEALDFVAQPDPALRCALLIDYGETLSHAHAGVDQVRQVFLDAMELARSLADATRLARAVERCTEYLQAKNVFFAFGRAEASRTPWLAQLEAGCEEALENLASVPDSALHARVLLARAMLHAALGEHGLARQVSESAAERARRAQALTEQLEARGLQWSLGLLFDLSAAERGEVAAEVLAGGRAAQRPDLQVAALSAQLHMAVTAGDRAEADRVRGDIERLASDCAPVTRPALGVARGMFAFLDGRLDEAQQGVLRSAQLFSEANQASDWIAALLGLHVWWLAILRGNAASLVAQADSLYERGASQLRLGRALLARFYVAAGRTDDARRELERLMPALDEVPRSDAWLFLVGVTADTCALLGDAERAAPLFERLRPYADRALSSGSVCLGLLARPLGTLAALLGRDGEARELLALAVRHAESLASPVLEALVELELARVQRCGPRASRRPHDRPQLEAALRAAAKLGLNGLLQQARDLGLRGV